MRLRVVRALSLIVFAALSASAQDLSGILSDISKQNNRNAKVTGLKFNCVPSDCRVRPFESIPIQVQVMGEVQNKDGSVRKGRLRRAPGRMRVVEKEGGAVSKTLKFQGKDSGGFVDSSGGFASIFSQVSSDFTVFDTVMYVAPEKPGTYTIECDTEGVRQEQKVTVDAAAPTTITTPEQYSFKPEDKSGEKYRALVEHWSPVFAQETWWQAKADVPTRWDFDNDFAGDNNWDNVDKGTSQAYIYYAVIESGTHWFLIYNAFHPRDYSDKCMIGSCHENDNEGAILCVQKDGTEFGKLLVMETLAHDNLYSYTADGSVSGGIHNVEGRIEFRDKSHPLIFIESGGHGMYGGNDMKHGRYRGESDDFNSGTGVTYVYKGVAERPRSANDRNVGYELLPILTHWWTRVENTQDRMFDVFGPYEPWGGRPGAKIARMGKTFYGRKQAANKAKPFWGWHDNKTLKAKVLNAGQWGLDPAYAFSKNLTFSGPWSLDYVYNPYLGIGGEEVTASKANVETVQQAAVAPSGTSTAAPEGSSLLPALGGVATEGFVEISATVDGTAAFHIFESTAAPEVLAGQNVTNQKAQFSMPVPSGAGYSWTVEKKSGRGKVELTEQPGEANGYSATVRVEDTARGAGDYTFRLTWKKN